MESSPQFCKRCNTTEATLQIRADQVCLKCFRHYVTTKAVKRMETYKTRGSMKKSIKKFLLPISFGPSSICLLHIINSQLQAQLDRMGRTSYELVVIHINLEVDNFEQSKDRFEKIRNRYPQHKYVTAGIGEALNLQSIDWGMLGIEKPEIGGLNSPLNERFGQFMASILSVTSKADIVATLLVRLLVNIAKAHDCGGILFGDSTTRLAEKALTDTAKGRGFSLPWLLSDGISPHGLHFHYPLRDLLRKELLTFSSLTTPPLTEMIIYEKPSTQVSASSKMTTIDDLMVQYFETVEEHYPSIVANVVRTSSKLNAPPTTEVSSRCNLCGLPFEHGTVGIKGWVGDSGDQSSGVNSWQGSEQGSGSLCYGCSRSVSE